MTVERDSGSTEDPEIYLDKTVDQENPLSDEISLWLAGSIILFLILVFFVVGLIVRKVYFQPPVIRTAIERDIFRYRETIKNNPRDSEAHVGLASIYNEIEQPKKAVRELNTALALNPRSWNAHFELGIAYEAMGEPGNATSHFWRAANIDPSNELAFYQLGRLYEKQKDYNRAVQAFKKTLEINPTLADAHYHLGRCYEATNKADLAKQEYREALRYIKGYQEAEEALKRLK